MGLQLIPRAVYLATFQRLFLNHIFYSCQPALLQERLQSVFIDGVLKGQVEKHGRGFCGKCFTVPPQRLLMVTVAGCYLIDTAQSMIVVRFLDVQVAVAPICKDSSQIMVK